LKYNLSILNLIVYGSFNKNPAFYPKRKREENTTIYPVDIPVSTEACPDSTSPTPLQMELISIYLKHQLLA
jgi:hypothetical protein